MRNFLYQLMLLTCAVACVSVIATNHPQAAVKDSIAYQGRLLDASDKPVDGNLDVVFSLWTDSSGGTQLWSQTQTVAVSKGLFSICLGCQSSSFFDIFTDADLFLQTQIGGQPPMTPRTRIRYSPRAVMSSRVRGDIGTAPGLVVIGDTAGGVYAKVQSGLAQTGSALASGAARVTSSVDNTHAGIAIDESGVHITQVATADSSVYDQYSDTYSSSKYFIHKIHNGDRTRVFHGVYPDSTVFDEGGDFGTAKVIHRDLAARNILLRESQFESGGRKVRVREECDDGNASVVAEGDLDGDGVPDLAATTQITNDSATFRLSAIGSSTPARISTNFTVAKQTQGATFGERVDSDGDGVDDGVASFSVVPGTSSVAIKTKGTGADKDRVASVLATTGLDSATLACTGDLDGDGLPDIAVSQNVVPGSSSVAIRVKGTGADKDRVASVSSSADDSSSVSVCDFTDLTGGALAGSSATIDARAAGASLAIQTKGTSAKRVMASANNDSAGIAIDEPGVHVTMTSKGWDGKIKGRVSITDGATRKADLDGDGNGYLSHALGIGVLAPTNPIEVSGGAYCDGANWVNASDAGLKENFQPVDGEQLLDKIDQLPVSEWNYKSQSDTVRHIGPTAQDFQQVFGVGSDGHSISTIDPSGIALAAIKELNKKVKEVDELKSEVRELKTLVQKLAAEKAQAKGHDQ